METEPALVGADGAVELDAVAGVGLHRSLIINPGHAERKDAVRFDHSLDNLCLLEFGMLVIHILHRFQNLLNSLEILILPRILGPELGQNFIGIHKCY